MYRARCHVQSTSALCAALALSLEFREWFVFVPEFWLRLSYRAWTYQLLVCRPSDPYFTELN